MSAPKKQRSDLKEAARYVRREIGLNKEAGPKIGLILGSAWNFVVQGMKKTRHIPYRLIPNSPLCSAPGHDGELVVGELNGVEVIVASGRHHCYEGFTPLEVVFLPRLMALLGARVVILTNAAGGITYNPGELVPIGDQLNFSGYSSLRGTHVERFGKDRFVDMSVMYDVRLRQIARSVAHEADVMLQPDGVYAYMPGPRYETPAEIRALGVLGATQVGMSTVLEADALHAMGVRVFGLSCISNRAAGLGGRISGEEVMRVLQEQQGPITRFLSAFVPLIAAELS